MPILEEIDYKRSNTYFLLVHGPYYSDTQTPKYHQIFLNIDAQCSMPVKKQEKLIELDFK